MAQGVCQVCEGVTGLYNEILWPYVSTNARNINASPSKHDIGVTFKEVSEYISVGTICYTCKLAVCGQGDTNKCISYSQLSRQAIHKT
jgi:hypothetical protein